MKWIYPAGLIMAFSAIIFFGFYIVNYSTTTTEQLDVMESECEESGGVLARTRSGYVCVVPLHHAI